jgi:clan AA aspartic protease
MGLIYTEIELFNAGDENLFENGYIKETQIRKSKVTVMADTGAIRLTINESIQHQLGLKNRGSVNVTLADGSKKELQLVGPIRIKFKERDCITEAFVLDGNEEPLLGAVPMELMDLSLFPSLQKIDYNPLHPFGPVFSLK